MKRAEVFIERVMRLFHTLKHMHSRQLGYRIWYKIRNRIRRKGYERYVENASFPASSRLSLYFPPVVSPDSYINNTFTFLNLSYTFESEIDWEFSRYGKLWTYNLNYFDFLLQKEMSKEVGVGLINDFISRAADIRTGMKPYPISLRGINWIKFLTRHGVSENNIDAALYAQYSLLLENIEYHLLGNHLLENGFALLFGAYYFEEREFYQKAKEILTEELNEQILNDGAHFELSPMYHQIMLFRLLDCLNLMVNNDWSNDGELNELLREKASLMLGWLNSITFENGDIPLFNDSANRIAPTTEELNAYAQKLHIAAVYHPLAGCGYRKFVKNRYEIIIDVGNIGPDYIPGHAHSDTFNFELHIDNRPFIVDTGISTYDANERRRIERSTKSHNTVEVDGTNQSDVWGGFRVAKRAKVIACQERDNRIEATHDGYKSKGILHKREFICTEKEIVINDFLQGGAGHTNIAYLHFNPGGHVDLQDNIMLCGKTAIECIGAKKIALESYAYAPEFNKKIEAICAKIYFDTHLQTKFVLNPNSIVHQK
jgi:hypothetical protein